MEDISCFVSSECWSMEVFPVGVRLPKGDLHLGDGIRGVAHYPDEIHVKVLAAMGRPGFTIINQQDP